DGVAIVDRGKVIAQGTLDELLGTSSVRVRASGLSREGRAAIARFGELDDGADGAITVRGIDRERIPDLVSAIVGAGARVYALAPLARPMSRAEYVAGKWLGLVALVIAYGVTATIIELVAVQIVSGYLPPHPVEFLGFVIGEGVVILTFALMLSTRLAGMVGGVIAAILFGIAWMGGIVGGVGAAFNNATITHVATATKLILPTDGLWRGAVWSLEPSLVIAAQSGLGPAVAANPFFAAEPPPAAYVVWAVMWIVAMLALAVWSFRSREV